MKSESCQFTWRNEDSDDCFCRLPTNHVGDHIDGYDHCPRPQNERKFEMDDQFVEVVERLTEEFAERIAKAAANEREYYGGVQHAIETLQENLTT